MIETWGRCDTCLRWSDYTHLPDECDTHRKYLMTFSDWREVLPESMSTVHPTWFSA